ncbi:hypothetical protein SAMN06296416_101224 [Pseudoxanthomonas wuyuanensis]|uniref:Uncharacterized protein n=1 Tax=Pseudoxanthomonas wuyuanensis TaxID=1073196 RepID=A0A286CW64_9GAMM|nr:hypothetical protein SAMN06296416_101224 [Pseudoxanthomonas wuyuanensis]
MWGKVAIQTDGLCAGFESRRRPDRNMLPGSVSHPWLTRRRRPSWPAIRMLRSGRRIGDSFLSLLSVAEAAMASQAEPYPGGWGPRRARQGWRAPESGQDALTEGKAAPGRQDTATVRSPHKRPRNASPHLGEEPIKSPASSGAFSLWDKRWLSRPAASAGAPSAPAHRWCARRSGGLPAVPGRFPRRYRRNNRSRRHPGA